MAKGARLVAFATLCCCAACAPQPRIHLTRQTGGSAFLFRQFQAFDGAAGRRLSFADILRRCRGADVVLFGEQHGDPVCNQLEAQLLHALLDSDRPLILAMEFFEADVQSSIDAYLTERITEPAFLEQTRQSPSYLNTHRPLVELSRAARVPVIAANAPRRLVRAYRELGLTYEEYRAGLNAEDRRWLPVTSEYLTGPYRDRFATVMRSHTATTKPAARPASAPASQPASRPASAATQPSSQPVTRPASVPATMPADMPASSNWKEFYKAQLLWDDAMAESVANLRDRFPERRVLLIIGGFHVAHDGGTKQKLRQRRPRDRLVTIVYRANPSGHFTLRDEDRGAGDIVVCGLKAPKPKKTMPKPGKMPRPPTAEPAPATAPASPAAAPAPPTTTPTSLPAAASAAITSSLDP